MTTTVRADLARAPRLAALVGAARAVAFVVAIGVFLAAPPSLPWLLVVVASTNVVALAARAWMSGARPPLLLLVLNGLTVVLVLGFAVLTSG